VTLAHAMAGQGRLDEARKIMDVELARYRERRKAGANGVTFERDLAYALYVSAIAEPNDASGRARRTEELAEAGQALARIPADARRLYEARELTRLLAEAGRAG
jgi:hypothetical protein